jgi:methyl-accepting chemotaxis protein
VRGVNTMLDAILLPIGEGNRILAQISNGKIDELIAQTYKGDHEKMKQAVNNVALWCRPAEGNGAPDRGFERRPALRSRQAGAIPGRVLGDRARRQHHAGRDPAADRRRQPHSRPISNGKIDELIAQTYKGDHEKMKQAVNNVAVVLQSLQKELAR